MLTILTASVLYIIKYKFDDFILKPGKELLSGVIIDEWSREIDFVADSPQKDSLKNIVSDLMASIEKNELNFDDRFKSIFSVISSAVKDSIVESSELKFISEKIKTELYNERSTQD